MRGVSHSLVLGCRANESLTFLCESDDGGGSSCTLGVLKDTNTLPLHDGNTRCAGSEVNTDDIGRSVVAFDVLDTGGYMIGAKAQAG